MMAGDDKFQVVDRVGSTGNRGLSLIPAIVVDEALASDLRPRGSLGAASIPV